MRDPRLVDAIGFILAGLMLSGLGCARLGTVQASYPREFYQIPRKLPDNRLNENPRFIIYGDNRPGWRVAVLGKKQTWLTWKQLYLPIVYQLYLVGTGIVGGINYVRSSPDYGDSEARMVRDAIYARAGRDTVDFLINTGDIVTDGRRPKDWKRFINQYKDEVPVVVEYPFLPVSGNHDRTADSTYALPNFTDVFSYPLFYVFECPDVDFFVLDSNFLIDQYGYIPDDVQNRIFEEWFVSTSSDRPSWLERELAKSQKTFKVVVMHHPPIGYSEHYNDWGQPRNGADLSKKRQMLVNLFERSGVQVVFSGHEHCYQRNTLRYQTRDGGEGVMSFVITGGGGALLRGAPDAAKRDEITAAYAGLGLDVTPEVLDVVYNYCVVEVTSDRMAIEAVEVSKKGENDGKTIDRFVITPSGSIEP